MRMLVSIWILMTMVTPLVWAQDKNPVVEAHAVMATSAAHANSPLKIAVLAQVAAGYHINDHKPTLDYLIPTELKIDPNDHFAVKSEVYPKGTPAKFAFSDVPLSVYEGPVVVGALLETGKSLPPGTYPLKAMLTYQACNDHACLPPASVPLTLGIKIVPSNIPLKAVDADVFRRIKFE